MSRPSAALLRELYDNSRQFLGVLSPDGTLLDANRTALAFVNASAAHVVGERFWNTPWWRHSESLQERLRASVHLAASGRPVSFEADHRAMTGELVPVDVSLTPLRDDSGAVTHLYVQGQDVSRQVGAERRLADLLGLSAEAIVAVDDAQRIRLFNTGAERVFGYAADEVLGQPLDLLLPADARHAHRAHVVHFAGSDVPTRRMGERTPVRGRRRTGELFAAQATISRMTVAGQNVCVAVLRDLGGAPTPEGSRDT